MSTATSTQTTSTECPSAESSTTAADPVLTREEAIAILDSPDSELPELKRAGALRRKYKGNRVSIHLNECPQRHLSPELCLLRPVLPFQGGYRNLQMGR